MKFFNKLFSGLFVKKNNKENTDDDNWLWGYAEKSEEESKKQTEETEYKTAEDVTEETEFEVINNEKENNEILQDSEIKRNVFIPSEWEEKIISLVKGSIDTIIKNGTDNGIGVYMDIYDTDKKALFLVRKSESRRNQGTGKMTYTITVNRNGNEKEYTHYLKTAVLDEIKEYLKTDEAVYEAFKSVINLCDDADE